MHGILLNLHSLTHYVVSLCRKLSHIAVFALKLPIDKNSILCYNDCRGSDYEGSIRQLERMTDNTELIFKKRWDGQGTCAAICRRLETDMQQRQMNIQGCLGSAQ